MTVIRKLVGIFCSTVRTKFNVPQISTQQTSVVSTKRRRFKESTQFWPPQQQQQQRQKKKKQLVTSDVIAFIFKFRLFSLLSTYLLTHLPMVMCDRPTIDGSSKVSFSTTRDDDLQKGADPNRFFPLANLSSFFA